MAFRLLRLLRLYEQEEDQRMQEYQRAQLHRDECVQAVLHWERALVEASLDEACQGEQLRQTWTYRCRVLMQLDSARERQFAAEKAVIAARERLLAARKQRKTMQSLESKHNARVQAELFRQEQQAVDETGLRNYLVANVQNP